MSKFSQKLQSLEQNKALAFLVCQNAGLILLTKYSSRETADHYSRSTVILLSEVLKLVTCLLLQGRSNGWCWRSTITSLGPSPSNLIMIMPATLYVVQNLLQFRAISGLSPAVYITGAQLKVFFSGVFSMFFLARPLTGRQIFSFFPLMLGVALVQWPRSSSGAPAESNVGAAACLLGAVSISGIAGVFLEHSFKREKKSSLWSKNFFLALFSTPAALCGMFLEHEQPFSQFLDGFDAVVVGVILLLALGGLLSAVVMKTAGTLTKCYAVSISIVVCTIVSVLSGTQDLSLRITAGTLLVILSTGLYAS
mmetsp:Transcript_5357/g.22689  ORF Transcript_5357/g.22689 Transcript_5357/m.22689 type:complete len:309 (+) Transcript_5357:208-1134(+)